MIYLDNAATTKPLESVVKKASEFLADNFYNPSALYMGGINCANQIKTAKEYILKSLGAINHYVIFNSCGSEGDNQAIFGCVKKGVFVTDKGEHSAVYKSFLELKNKGQTVFFCDLNKDGSIDTTSLFNILTQNNVDFVSIMHVNNETGAINDVNAIAKKIKEINKKTIVHVDGVQGYGKIPYKISNDIDFYAISAHKINAIKGTGALICKKNVHINPLIFGGGQENDLRSGTENVFGIMAFYYASLERYSKLNEFYNNARLFYNTFEQRIDKENTVIISTKNGSPYIFTFSVKGVKGEVLMHALEQEGIIVGNGSACSSKNRYSRVIEACGYDNSVLDGVVRVSFSPYDKLEDVEKAIETVNKTILFIKGKMSK